MDLDAIRARIPDYADYGDINARHQVDKQIRAVLGEALSAARDHFRPEGGLGERLDGMILRCEFSDQRVIRASDRAHLDGATVDHIHALDRQLIESADRVRAVDAVDALPAALDDAARLLDERFGAIADAPS